MSSGAVAAVDLGATSGRVMLGRVGENELSLHPVARFPNQPVRIADGLHWNILELYRNVLAGLETAARDEPDLASAGIDSWAVDYALLQNGRMLGTPFHYRDERTAAGVERTHARVSPEELHAANGLQHLPFNTLHQLAADDDLERADTMLLIPDLLGYWLTGRAVAERSNASTTGLLSVETREWDDALIERLGLPRGIFPDLVDAGTMLEPITALGAATALRPTPLLTPATTLGGGLPLVAVGSHDTASAVVAVPASSADFAYISCGTWGLVGVELEHPVLTDESRRANFTNEGGVDGRVRYLHNVMGLWLLSEAVREWERAGETIDLPALIEQAADASAPAFNPNDPRFLPPGAMTPRIAAWFEEHDVPGPQSRAEVVRSILESLALAFADAVARASALSGHDVRVIHIVGGGSQNALLCQLVADRSGLPVLAGPVEATALGNVLVQARAAGLVAGSLESLRSLVAAAFPPLRYDPS